MHKKKDVYILTHPLNILPRLLNDLLNFHVSDIENIFYINYYENVNNNMKNHDIISNNISINKGKNTYEERICNQQEIKLL